MKIIFRIAVLFVGILFFVNLSFASASSNKITISRISKNELKFYHVHGGAGFMITSSIGTAIVTDPYDVDEDVNADIVVVSHDHDDHNDDDFLKRMKNSKISLYKPESFVFKDIKVKSIASEHTSGNLKHKMPINVIYILELDGIRIAHMGDIGQEKLTDQQLKDLDRIDIVFILFANSPFNSIKESLKIVDQINPKIIIPTHLDKEGYLKLHKVYNRVDHHYISWEVDKNYINSIEGNRNIIILIPEKGSIIEQWEKEL